MTAVSALIACSRISPMIAFIKDLTAWRMVRESDRKVPN